VAKIAPATTVTGKEILAPKVALFSSRGPSPDYPDIIKVGVPADNQLKTLHPVFFDLTLWSSSIFSLT
jgi:hypothetical protein